MSVTPLKLAVISSGKKQLEISRNCGINPTKLNLIINGWTLPNDKEMTLLTMELEKPMTELFPKVNEKLG